MNDSTRKALADAALECDRIASAVETEADLWREAAEHARRGEVALMVDARERAGKAAEAQNPQLLIALLTSALSRDPELSRQFAADREALVVERELRTIDSMDQDQLRTTAIVHSATCPKPRDCRLLARVRGLLWR